MRACHRLANVKLYCSARVGNVYKAEIRSNGEFFSGKEDFLVSQLACAWLTCHQLKTIIVYADKCLSVGAKA